ncbi:hypothetical protein ACFGWM_03420 [Pasteurella multocida]
MSNSHTHEMDLFDPFANQPKSSFFNKVGRSLGGIFVSVKKAAKHKYVEMTQGINQRIAAEDELHQAEIFSHLNAQAEELTEEFEQDLQQRQKRWFWIAFVFVLIAFFGGIALALFYLT